MPVSTIYIDARRSARPAVARWGLALAAAVVLLLTVTPGPVAAQGRFPDVGVILVAEVRDTVGWLALHDQVLRTGQATNPLAVSVAGTSPRRAITVTDPQFTVSFVRGSRSLTVTVTGKVPGIEAVSALGGFEQAVVASQASDGELELGYGQASVAAYLVELHFTRE
jgi:hypothetical protein